MPDHKVGRHDKTDLTKPTFKEALEISKVMTKVTEIHEKWSYYKKGTEHFHLRENSSYTKLIDTRITVA